MPLSSPTPIPRKESIDVAHLLDRLRRRVHLDLEVCAGSEHCAARLIVESNLHRPGLALAGYVDHFTSHRIQVMGNSEVNYLKHLPVPEQTKAMDRLLSFTVPVIFVTNGNALPEAALRLAENRRTPVVTTRFETMKFMSILQDFLDDQFAMQTMVHGTMVDVYGIGILIAGRSGIGKSEVALDLVERGQRLVADDAVMVTRKGSVLMASATDVNKHFMEIRGLGVLDVMSMFGIRSIRYQKRLEVVVELTLWEEGAEVERTGLNHQTIPILDVEIPLIRLPMTPGKNITVVAESIAMNHLLRHYGYDSAIAFQEIVKERIKMKSRDKSSPSRAIDYFEGDME